MITAKILADSVNPSGSRLTSFLLTYPRFIHSEFMTHRVFSRNAASSRAIPFHKMVKDIIESPAQPEYWSCEHKGMQAMTEVDEYAKGHIKDVWEAAQYQAIEYAEALSTLGLAKSLCNRMAEPFSHITVLATATDKGLADFFALRAHPAAMPEFQVLAYRMLELYLKSEPTKKSWGQWHIPSFRNMTMGYEAACDVGLGIDEQLKISTARCARLSYLTFDGEHSPEKDIALHDQLLASKHMSPFEHCAQANGMLYGRSNYDVGDGLCGWQQYRKMIEGENQTSVNLDDIMATKPSWITL